MATQPAKAERLSSLRHSLPPQLPAFLANQRWFGGKARQIRATEIQDVILMGGELLDLLVLVVRVTYAGAAEETYVLPLSLVQRSVAEKNDSALFLSDTVALIDALQAGTFPSLLLKAIHEKSVFRGEKGELRAFQTTAFKRLCPIPPSELEPRPLTGEQSNTSIIYDYRLILKFFRRIEEGINPDLELGIFLTEKAHYPHIPQLAGWLEYRNENAGQMTQAILQAFVPNQGDAWRYTLKSLGVFYEAASRHANDKTGSGSKQSAPDLEMPEFVRESVAPYLEMAGLLGERTAALHLALASDPNDPAFAPEPFTPEFQRSLENSVLELTSASLSLLRERLPSLPQEWREAGNQVAAREGKITKRIQSILRVPIRAIRTRVHGDYHLGQVLYTGSDFVIIDFEGEPARPLQSRRAKQSPLQDVAGMLRSFHYAAVAPLLGAACSATPTGEIGQFSAWAERWNSWMGNRFLTQYFDTSKDAPSLPADSLERQNLLDLYLLEKAVYELAYELNNRPDWVGIPLEGIQRLIQD